VRDPAGRKADGGLVRIDSRRRGCKHRKRGEHSGGDRIGACLDRVDDNAPRRLRDFSDRDRQQQRAREQLDVGRVVDLGGVVEQTDQLGDEMLGRQVGAVAHVRHDRAQTVLMLPIAGRTPETGPSRLG
jgi:hypothetical protein